jgi:hypothetical protein
VGVCDGFSPANIFYVEQGGYAVERIDIDDLEKNKFPDFHIRKSENEHKLVGVDLDELKNIGESSDFIVKKYSQKNNDWTELINLVNQQGFVISRIVSDGDDVYCGFEKEKKQVAQSFDLAT